VSQRGVQLVIGKLLTDMDFRQRFEAKGRPCLVRLRERGIDLNETEITALAETDSRVWSAMAQRIDRRLHRVTRVKRERANTRIPQHLTERQQRVLAKLCEGRSNREIAIEEGVSEGAVKATVRQLFRKTGVQRRTRLVRLALESALTATRPPS
jgi:DNA-binding NarL/FixJ family response regulator